MNREQRRHPKMNVRQVIQDFATIGKLKKAIEGGWKFNNGDKVRLDLAKIKEHPNYADRVPSYREFCEKNADRVFTVEYNEGMHPSVVCLAEDESRPKWLFWDGDLKLAEDSNQA